MGIDFLLGYAMGEAAAARTVQRAASIPPASSVSVGDIEDVSERIDRLVLLCAAMWEILEQQGATEEQLEALVEKLDREDSLHDGKMRVQPTRCAKCESLVPAGSPICQFCGEPTTAAEDPGPFHAVST